MSRILFTLLLTSAFVSLTACGGDDCPNTTQDAGSQSDADDDTQNDANDDTQNDIDDPNAKDDFGDTCVEEDTCVGNVCLRVVADLEEGFCSGYCYDVSDCPNEEWDCVFLRNNGTDAAFMCVENDFCIDIDEDGFGIGPGCDGTDCNDNEISINPFANELCDGTDNDCDGIIDDNPVDANQDCDSEFQGICGSGRSSCDSAGNLTCVSTIIPVPEICDGLDNNCQGDIDEDTTDIGFVCPTGLPGVCDRGVSVCQNGGVVCIENIAASDELCDGLDNDCDGSIDENFGIGQPCFRGEGICRRAGTSTCNEDPAAPSNCDAVAAAGNPAETCDYLDDDCDGEIDEDFKDDDGNYTQPNNCGGCGVNCNAMWVPNAASFHVVPFCSIGGCDYACEENYQDLDLDPSNGCEFAPDPGSIYVSTIANNGANFDNCGTYNSPCATIQFGIQRANNIDGKNTVRVSAGIYRENIILENQINVLGGFNSVNWNRNPSTNVTTISGQNTSEQDAITVSAINITGNTVFSGFTIQAANGQNATNSLLAGNSTGVYIRGTNENFILEDNTILAGIGGNGMLGNPGSSGQNGENGHSGQDRVVIPACTTDRTGGSGGSTLCGTTNVSGGNGGTSECPVIRNGNGDGENGENNSPTSLPNRPTDELGEGGDGGFHMSGEGSSCIPYNNPIDPMPGFHGAGGNDAIGANGTTDSDGAVIENHWRGVNGSNGNNGTHGTGGGGGGATAGLVSSEQRYYGASGGGGGAGGCAGTAGSGGTAGGGSFAVFLLFSGTGPSSDGNMPVIRNNYLARNLGGNGGAGGPGGAGGDPGLGGLGGIGTNEGNTYDFCMFDAGSGAEGGRGGHGSGGAGGIGGVSYDIYLWNTNNHTNNYLENNTFDQENSVNTGGIGGTGGNASNTEIGLGTNGINGESLNLKQIP